MSLALQPKLSQSFEEEPLSHPEGGFKLATVGLIVSVWFAHRKGLLSLNALRVWGALQEMAARRSAHYFAEKKAGRKPAFVPHFRLAELGHLVGLPVKVAEKALNELVEGGFVVFSAGSLRFIAPSRLPWSDDLRSEFEEFLADHFKTPNRKVPLPRRTLVMIAEADSSALIWCLLAYCIRCLFYFSKTQEYRCTGTVKSSWVAETGGFSERWAKKIRARLLKIGWLVRLGAPQVAMNARGEKFEVNPEFSPEKNPVVVNPEFHRLASVDDRPTPATISNEPLEGVENTELHEEGRGDIASLPVENPPPETGSSSPPPTAPVHPYRNNNSNFCETHKDQDKETRPRAAENPGPGVYRPQVSEKDQGPKGQPPLPPPRLSSIRLEDFASMPRLMELYRQALKAGLVNGSDHERL